MMTMTHTDYYTYLGLTRDATSQQIEKALHERAKTVHPDKAKDNPDAQKEFAYLTKIYHTLIDPARRKKYDATLPPPAPALNTLQDLAVLWKRTAQDFLALSERYTKAFDAISESVPIALEDDLLVVGLDPAKANLIGYLNPIEEQAKVRNVLKALTGRTLDFRLITGTAVEDWDTIKLAESHKRKMRENVIVKADTSASSPETATAPLELRPRAIAGGGNWDEFLNSLATLWTGTDNRTLPQVRARFILEQVPALVGLEESSRMAGVAEEEIQRNVARILERVGTLTGIDAGVVALEYLRYRRLLGGF